MDKLIHDIIDYSRNSRIPAAGGKLNLHDFIEELVELIKYTDVDVNTRFNVKIDRELLVLSDSSRLQVILNNLLSNSIKYADRNKAESVITITASATSNSFTFSVEDNGDGIAEDHQDKIFNMFYRASEKASGSGLGLYIVKETLEKMNGTISHQSTLGKGSLFTVTIPMEG